MGTFKLTQNGSKWRFSLLAGNHEPILNSETYETKSAAENGIESVRKNSQRDGAFEVKETKNGQYHFVIKATNGQVVGSSETYASQSGCANGIESVKKNAADAEVKEV